MSLKTNGAIQPWSNAAKREIKELKKGFGRKQDFGMITLNLNPT